MLGYLKKMLVLITAVIAIVISGSSKLFADQNTTYLQQIAANTLNTLNLLSPYVLNWMTQLGGQSDTTTPTLQQNFALIGQSLNDNLAGQLNLQPQLIATLFSPPPPAQPFTAASLSLPANNPSSILNTIPNLNQLTYITLLGYPPASKSSDVNTAPTSYVTNASGGGLIHTIPGTNWRGSLAAQQRYSSVYNTIMAAESFGEFVLSKQLTDTQQNQQFTQAQSALIQQVSGSDWATQVSSEELGMVIRHILLFQSQMYVLISDLIQTQRQLLQAQVINNALIIMTNQNNESLLISNAQGINPQPAS